MWAGTWFKASKETKAEVHGKLQDYIFAFHSSFVSLISGAAVGDRIMSRSWVVSKPCEVSCRSKNPLTAVKATRFGG